MSPGISSALLLRGLLPDCAIYQLAPWALDLSTEVLSTVANDVMCQCTIKIPDQVQECPRHACNQAADGNNPRLR